MPRKLGVTVPLRSVWFWAICAGGYSCLALAKPYPPLNQIPDIPAGLDAALSFAMALVIAFRVNRAYERWWEARILWGTLVNASRNLAVKVRELFGISSGECQASRDVIVQFAMVLKDHLRNDLPSNQCPGTAHGSTAPAHLPSAIVRQLYRQFSRWKNDCQLVDADLWILDQEARVLLNVCGGCERIKNTQISVSWRFFTWQCITVYLLVLPWGLVADFGICTILITILAAYFVIAGEAIAHYVEEPFGFQEDHLDLDHICEGIDRSVSEILLTGSSPKTQSDHA